MITQLTEEQKVKARSYKLLIWFGMISIVMMFSGLISAYIVSSSRKDWFKDVEMPSGFFWSTIIIILSSITFQLALKSMKKEQSKNTTYLLLTTFLLGILFAYLQYYGFKQFTEQGLYVTGPSSNVTVSLIIIVIFMHLIHLFGGLISLLIIIYNQFKQRYNSVQTTGIELGTIYWHFLGVLWILLFLFFYTR
ncbi:MAG: cytochrome c oxidase subunit 3 [Flavobacterium sp.]|jgi:cytochrome c oxidase subunit 3